MHAQQGHIGLGVATGYLGLVGLAVHEADGGVRADLHGDVHHMLVRHDESGGADNEPGAEGDESPAEEGDLGLLPVLLGHPPQHPLAVLGELLLGYVEPHGHDGRPALLHEGRQGRKTAFAGGLDASGHGQLAARLEVHRLAIGWRHGARLSRGSGRDGASGLMARRRNVLHHLSQRSAAGHLTDPIAANEADSDPDHEEK